MPLFRLFGFTSLLNLVFLTTCVHAENLSAKNYDSLLSKINTDWSRSQIAINEKSNVFIDGRVSDPEELTKLALQDEAYFHLFSHGRAGSLLINGVWMNPEQIVDFLLEDLKIQPQQFRGINIYGCNFGSHQIGAFAVAQLEKQLGVQVFASTDLTGFSGDWQLEIGGYTLNAGSYKHTLQLDKEHYLPPFVGALYDNVNYAEEEVVITTNSTTSISVTVTNGSGVAIPGSPFSVVKGSPRIISYTVDTTVYSPLAQPRAGLGTKYTDRGLIFNSSSDFAVSYRSRGSSQAEILSAKGRKAKGKHFKWAVPRGFYGNVAAHSYISIFAVDNSVVTITGIDPATTITGVSNHNGTLTANLNAGESIIYELKDNTSANISGHVGADIVSTGNIIINTGGQNAQFLNDNGSTPSRDHCIDQIIPIEFLGLEYILVQANGGTAEKVFVTATENNTEIFLNGGGTSVAVLNEGDQYIFTGAHWSANGTMYLESTKPIYVHHVLQGRSGGLQLPTQGMNFISPLSCFAATEIDEIGNLARIGITDYATSKIILLETIGATTIARQNNTVQALPSPITVIGNSQYQIREFTTITPGSNWSFVSDAAVFAYFFGSNNLDAGFASYVSSFPEIPAVSIKGNTNLCGNNTFRVSSGPWSAYQWYKDGVPILGANDSTYFAQDPASYSVEVSYGSGGSCSQFSSTVVNPCPGMTLTNTRTAGPSPVANVGDVLTYEVSVENTGNVELTEIVPTFILSDNSSVLLVNPSGDSDSDGLLDPNETWVYTATDTVSIAQYNAGLTLTTTASIVTEEIPGPTTDNVSTEIFNRPTNLVATKAGNGDIEVSFTSGTNGGSPITNYEYSSDGGTNWTTFSPAQNSSPVTISGLTGNLIMVQLRAVNALTVSAASDTVIVPGGIFVVLSGGDSENSTWIFENNTIRPNSSVDVSLNVSDLLGKLTNPLTVEGLFITVNTPVSYTGANALTLTALNGNITLNASVDLKDLTLNGKGIVASGEYVNVDGDFSNNDSLVLKYGINGFSQLRFTGNYIGGATVRIEQQITGTGWHNLSNPFENQTASSFGLVGTDRHPNAENLRQWNSEAAYTWENISSGTAALESGRGYTGYFGIHPDGYASGLQLGTGPWTLSITGKPMTTVSPILHHYVKIAQNTWEEFFNENESDGWNLVGNPFTSILDFSQLTLPDNVNNAFYIWDPNKVGGAGYVSWSGAGITDPLIAPLQAFWVQTAPAFDNGGGAARALNMSMATHGTVVSSGNRPGFFKTAGADFDRVVLRVKPSAAQEWADHTVIALVEGTDNGYDADWDAYKWLSPGTTPNLYSVYGQSRLANNAVSYSWTSTGYKSIPVGFSSTEAGAFSIGLDEDWLLRSYYLTLEDRVTGKLHDLVNAGAYGFTHDPSITNRFILHIGNNPITLSAPSEALDAGYWADAIHISSLRYDGMLSCTLVDITGREILHRDNLEIVSGGTIEIQLAQRPAPGTYVLHVVAGEQTYAVKVTL